MLGQLGPQVNLVQEASAAGAQAQVAGFTVDPAASKVACATKICFGSGDAMQKAISSLQIIVNGAAIAQTRQRDYMRSLQKCWFDKSVFQKRFSQWTTNVRFSGRAGRSVEPSGHWFVV